MAKVNGCGIHETTVEFCPSCQLVAELREMYDQLLDAHEQLNKKARTLKAALEVATIFVPVENRTAFTERIEEMLK